MSASRRTALILFGASVAAAAVRADKLDNESKRWLEGVAAIILPEEIKAYGQLKDRVERVEFEKIFWARRDLDIRTPDNQYQQEFLARAAQANERFGSKAVAGSATGCGRLLILLGEPDSIRDDAMGVVLGAPAGSFVQVKSGVERSSANETTGLPGRQPQVWTYRDRRDVTFKGGEAKIAVDGQCGVHLTVGANLDRIAARRIANPGLSYKVAAGRITRLADLLPRPTPAQEMLESSRKDFEVAGQVGYYRAEGATALIGLVRAEAAGPSEQGSGGTKTADVTVAARAVTGDGRVAAIDERRVATPRQAGSVLVSYRLFLRPGRYTLDYGVLDGKTGRGAVASETIDVPDLNAGSLAAGTVLVLQDIVEGVNPNPADPFDAFLLGGLKLVPRFGNTFARSEAAHFFYSVSGSVDEASGRSDLTVRLSLLKGTSVVADTPSQSFSDPHVVTAVGPVPLQFEPGAYTARLKVKDNLTQQEATFDQGFEVR
jgi:GWxTD domain-containing protein